MTAPHLTVSATPTPSYFRAGCATTETHQAPGLPSQLNMRNSTTTHKQQQQLILLRAVPPAKYNTSRSSPPLSHTPESHHLRLRRLLRQRVF